MKTPYQRLWLLLKPDQKEIYQVYTYSFFKGVIALSLPLGIQSIINLIQAGSFSIAWMVLVGIVITGIAIGISNKKLITFKLFMDEKKYPS